MWRIRDNPEPEPFVRSSMDSQNSLPLYKTVHRNNIRTRSIDTTILSLLVSLLVYRLCNINSHGLAWFIAFLCESCFTIDWALNLNCKWNPVDHIPFVDRLPHRVSDLPSVDMFVTTADSVLEPPIMTVNTVLSLMAVNYPTNRLACYVSDDGCSLLTYYSLVEAANFAKQWVPFCKKYNVQLRAPFRYFLDLPAPGDSSDTFLQEWKNIKDEYEELCRNIEDAALKIKTWDLKGDFAVFSNNKRQDHPTILKVIWENTDDLQDGLPHLIYISREKRPNHRHEYKAGAMNVLTRVSGLMTNAPYMLNVDCDMYANNPEIVREAMCLLLGSTHSAFVQTPQIFYDNPSPPLLIWSEFMFRGTAGIQGPFYIGTGCFHTRKIIYGLLPEDLENGTSLTSLAKDKLADGRIMAEYGDSKEFLESVSKAFLEKSENQNKISNSICAASKVARSDYEFGSGWGEKFGWMYGSTTEDMNTGLKIHSKGWKSLYLTPQTPAFLGCSPSGGLVTMVQHKRWASGLLLILLSKNNPVFGTLFAKLKLRQCLAYVPGLGLALRPLAELPYLLLPAYCLITNTSFLPKVQDPAICITIVPWVIQNLYSISQFIGVGSSINTWWICQKYEKISLSGPWLFGGVDVVLNKLGLTEIKFEVTRKDSPTSTEKKEYDDNVGKFIFDRSIYIVPGTTIVLVHFAAMFMYSFGLQPTVHDGIGSGLGEVMGCAVVLLQFSIFVRGFFERGKYGIPWVTVCKSSVLALLFILLPTILG